MEFLFGFIIGTILGASVFIAYGYYQLSKLKQDKEKIAGVIKKKIDELDEKRESIRTRLSKAQELTQQQLDLRAQAEMPSKNALHSRYKNGLVGEISKLEEEKLAVLKSILQDGYDPIITVLDENGNRQELSLSQFVDRSPKPNEEVANDSPNTKRIGKFTVVKGGKDDSTVH